MKRKMKQLLAMFLSIVLLVGMLPTSALATETNTSTDTDYLFFATDRHANTSIIGTMIDNMEAKIGENELEYLGLGGDMVGSGNSHPAYNSSTVLGEVTSATSSLSAANVDIVAGIHDTNVTDDAGIVLPYTGGGANIYEGDKYYVYGVPESCISGEVSAVDPETEANDFITWANGSDIDKSKVIIVLSHYPLHQRRNDNDGAVYWAEALNTVAVGDDTTIDRDVVFFWGHNHTNETSTDTAVYHVAPGGSISVQGGSSNQTIYFTYANAGYLNAKSSATLMEITDTTITFNKYTNSNYSTTGIVTRVVTEPTLTSIAISGTSEYYVGAELDLTVTATYSDTTTKDVTAEAELTGYDMSTAGTYTVTASYENITATYNITVNAVQLDSIQITTEPTKLTYNVGEELDTTGMVVTANYNNGKTAEITDYTVAEVDMSAAGTKVVTVSYTEGEVTKTATFGITVNETVKEVSYFTISEGTTVYTVGDKLSFKLYVSYTDGSSEYVTQDDCEITCSCPSGHEQTCGTLENMMNTVADGSNNNYHQVKITYGGYSATYDFTVGTAEDLTDTENGTNVKVYVNTGVIESITAVTFVNANVESAMSAKGIENYAAYDITPSSALRDGNYASISLPVDAEWDTDSLAAYYVSDDGQSVEEISGEYADGYYTFRVEHFSTYVVTYELADGTTIETESGNATTEGTPESSTTKMVANAVTVYKLVANPVSGQQYLIVNSNTGTGYGLDGDTTGYATTAFTGGDGYYLSWDDTAQIGTAFTVGSDVYLTTSGAYLWTAGSNSFSIGYSNSSSASFGSTTYTYTLDPDNSTTGAWSLSSNKLSISLVTADSWFGTDTNTTYYLYNSGSTWSMGTTGSNVYFYEPVTIYTVSEETVTTPATPGYTYSVAGTDITDAVALSGQTVTLSSVLYSTPDGGETTDITASSGLTPVYEVVNTKGNPDVITNINGDTAILSGTAGTAVVKVTYTSGDLVAWDEFIVTATAVSDDLYTITMHKQTTDADGNPVAGDEITAPITIKNIMSGMQDSVWAVVKADGIDLGALGDKLTWTMTGDSIGSIDAETGVITFNGTEGTATVTAYYTCPEGRVIQASVTYSVTVGNYTVPEDGTDDFPEYPDPGAIRFDKHATAVGNFSETGIAQVELSMTGVPYGTDTAIDVVVMLDMTGSMSDNGMEAAEEATKAFVKKIVQNDDGTYNDNRVAVYAFNSGDDSPYELVSLGTIDSDSELETANTAIDTASDKQERGGTPFDEAAQKCHDVLAAAKTDGTGNDRKQFCVFMSDGGPTTYEGSDGYTYYGGNASGDRAITSYIGGYTSSTASDWTYSLPTEYWTDDMKADGVTVYTVGLLLQDAPSNPSPYSSMTDSTYNSTTDSLTTIGSHYYFTSTILKNMASDTNKYIDIFNVDNASKATAAFENIAQSILDAATDVKVTDKIASDYTMVFEAPNATVGAALPEGQEMYIEVKDYVLNPVYGSDGTTIVDYTRGSGASLMKLYLGKSGTTYYAASDASGTAYASPTFNQTAIGTMYYWTTTQTSSGVSVTVDGKTYYFDETGISSEDEDYVAANWFNMASGAYAFGNITTTDIVDDDTGEVLSQNTICNDLIIATPYFVYNASTKMLTWTAAKLSTSELTLSYFLYLDESGGYSGAENETPAGTYETNEYAYLSYTNFQGTDCQQTFPVPQMTWNGAQVSYVFYLVNDQGQPVNRAGKVVPFSEAVYVTDVFTYSIVWNDLEQVASLEAEYLAEDLVPSVYSLYDAGATYNIHVFEDEEGQDLNNHFIIGSSSSTYTTYVFNTKADATKYKNPATYAATSTYKCKEYVEGGQYTDEKGAYNIVTKNGATVVETGFDFSNTTVAFAVTWTPGLAEDTVVVDFGLDVVIDVIKNDNMAAGVVGVRITAPSGVATDGTYDRVEADTLTSVDLYIDANNDADTLKELKIGTATVENLNEVRFSLDKTNGMQFTDPAVFYYEADVNYYVDSELKTTSMYSKVTVIPATTVYYEDSFVTFTNSSNATDEYGVWTTVGTTINSTQDQDRPGTSQISADLDADNNYGYDSAYTNMTQYSMGSAKKVTVTNGISGMASFDFYGTGFDVISMTDTTTGMIIVNVYDVSGTLEKSLAVNTYYGYAYGDKDGDGDSEWYTVSSNDPNALYQVPVINVSGLTYGKHTVKIVASYNSLNDQTGTGSYDFYLDAIRIYAPCNTDIILDDNGTSDDTTDDITVGDVYKEDGEGWPVYQELRSNVIASADFTGGTINGIVFVDSNSATSAVSDYVSYGPNNELYLAPGQSIIFSLNLANYSDKIATVQLGMKSVDANGASYVIIDGTTLEKLEDLTGADKTVLKTTTDMYYDITALKDAVIVIYNAGEEGVLSLTDIKVTFKENPGTIDTLCYVDYDVISAVVESMNSTNTEEETEETFEPTVTVTSSSATVNEGGYVTVTVTTSNNVEAVSVDGKVVSTYIVEGDNRVWTTDVTEISADSEDGTKTIEVVAYDSVGNASEPKAIIITVNEVEQSVTNSVKSIISNIFSKLKNWFGW